MDKSEQDEAIITILRQVESGELRSDAAFLAFEEVCREPITLDLVEELASVVKCKLVPL